MTSRRLPPRVGNVVAIAAVFFVSACATATIEDAVPVSAATPAAEPAMADATKASAPPIETSADAPAAQFARPGDYPNLNVVPQPASTQITAAEKDADTTLLRSIREQQKAQGAAGASKSSADDLRRLGRTHASDALKQIEGE